MLGVTDLLESTTMNPLYADRLDCKGEKKSRVSSHVEQNKPSSRPEENKTRH